MLLTLYILSVLWFVAAILVIGYKFPAKDAVVTPLTILTTILILLIAFIPYINTAASFLFTIAICCKLDEEGYFDKFKAWWLTPIHKNKG